MGEYKKYEEFTESYSSYSGADITASIFFQDINLNLSLASIQTISYSVNNSKTPVRGLGDMNLKGYVLGPRTIAGSLIFTIFDKHIFNEVFLAYKQKDEYFSMLFDELPPFDITISFANEYGNASRIAIYDVVLLNEGQVMSINDIYTENTYQYIAKNIEYMVDEPVPNKDNTEDNTNSNDEIEDKFDTVDAKKENEIIISGIGNSRTIKFKKAMKNGKLNISNENNTYSKIINIEEYYDDIYIKNKDIYIKNLPIGQYVVTLDNESYWANKKVIYIDDIIYEESSVPVINAITNTEIEIGINKDSKTIHMEESSLIYKPKKLICNINKLEPSKMYNIYSKDNDKKSKSINISMPEKNTLIFDMLNKIFVSDMYYSTYRKYLESLVDNTDKMIIYSICKLEKNIFTETILKKALELHNNNIQYQNIIEAPIIHDLNGKILVDKNVTSIILEHNNRIEILKAEGYDWINGYKVIKLKLIDNTLYKIKTLNNNQISPQIYYYSYTIINKTNNDYDIYNNNESLINKQSKIKPIKIKIYPPYIKKDNIFLHVYCYGIDNYEDYYLCYSKANNINNTTKITNQKKSSIRLNFLDSNEDYIFWYEDINNNIISEATVYSNNVEKYENYLLDKKDLFFKEIILNRISNYKDISQLVSNTYRNNEDDIEIHNMIDVMLKATIKENNSYKYNICSTLYSIQHNYLNKYNLCYESQVSIEIIKYKNNSDRFFNFKVLNNNYKYKAIKTEFLQDNQNIIEIDLNNEYKYKCAESVVIHEIVNITTNEIIGYFCYDFKNDIALNQVANKGVISYVEI